MRRWLRLLLLLAVAIPAACDDSAAPSALPTPAPRDGGSSREGSSETPGPPDGGGAADAAPPSSTSNLRVMAANTSSGNVQKYDSGEGIRMFQAFRPDVALIQELNYKSNSEADVAELVATAFGEGYAFYRESGMQLPNGIASRWPMLASGTWDDPKVDNRGFAYAKIAHPSGKVLWAVSVHLLTGSAGERAQEATSLVAHLKENVKEGELVVVGGDLNTDGRGESCLTTFGELLHTKAPYPVDQAGDDGTNATRGKPYDWVLAGTTLAALQVPTVVGTASLPAGLVFDSRVFTPLADVAPVLKTDSQVEGMQHMPVVKDFHL